MAETDSHADIAANLQAVRARIAAAARECGRDPAAVGLVAVSKFQPAERVAAALEAGHRLFGENRVQEAKGRWPDLKARYPGIRVHLVGPLQTNKVKDAVALFDVIETVDRPKLADALAAEMARAGRRPDCLIQVNTGEEEQKAGVAADGLADLLSHCREACGLPVTGLMCIPPAGEAPAPHFALLAELAARHGLGVLSMGMSGDYEAAIHQGATLVRVGTAIFGERVR
ncbi:MAG: YggS family pyridoxal phosphate-dependent enzyme [Alphaproteobacteria bacterium]|nr:YggS family pyridoxal phosphate-dependent enzyme [Alphaproteobacteria bacterium]